MNNNHQAEKQRMATLLHSPDLALEVLPQIKKTSWTLSGNEWIWSKYNEHVTLYKTAPTINILADYAAPKENEDLAITSARKLLKEYETQSPVDNAYFKETILKEARDTELKGVILETVRSGDWQRLKEAIEVVTNKSMTLPPRLDLRVLQTKPSDDAQNLLNEWAFERQAILAIVAPTGIGKSVMTMQLSTHFAVGKETLGFQPKRAFKVLVIQNEDSDNDVAIMRDGSLSKLSDAEKEKVYENLFFVRLRGASGKSFLQALDNYCKQFSPDIVFVNPLLKYYGGDPINTKEVSNFVNELETILERYNCGLILVHHTTKQSKQSRQNQVDSSYAGFGSGLWSNCVRDTIEIRSAKLDGYYKLISGKRSSKWGWRERYIRRSDTPTLPYWNDAADMDIKTLIAADKSNQVSSDNRDKVFSLIEPLPLTTTQQELVIETGLSERSIRNHIKVLLSEGRIAIADQVKGEHVKRYFRVGTSAANN